MAFEIAVIGTSWGGLAALHQDLRRAAQLVSPADGGIQHRHKDSGNFPAARSSGRYQALRVRSRGQSADRRRLVYIAPANYHVLVEHGHLSLSTEEPVAFSRPSIDVTFISAADAYRIARSASCSLGPTRTERAVSNASPTGAASPSCSDPRRRRARRCPPPP